MGKISHLRVPIQSVLDMFPDQWVAFVVSERDMERGYMIAHTSDIKDQAFLDQLDACRRSLSRWGGDVISIRFSGQLIPPGVVFVPTPFFMDINRTSNPDTQG